MAKGGTAAGGQSSGTFSGSRIDLHRLRIVFPDRWSDFLKGHFRDVRHVGFFFDVDDKTARNWWAGVTGPSASAVVAVASVHPAVIPFLMGDAA